MGVGVCGVGSLDLAVQIKPCRTWGLYRRGGRFRAVAVQMRGRKIVVECRCGG